VEFGLFHLGRYLLGISFFDLARLILRIPFLYEASILSLSPYFPQ
jgi:hypothetical protein